MNLDNYSVGRGGGANRRFLVPLTLSLSKGVIPDLIGNPALPYLDVWVINKERYFLKYIVLLYQRRSRGVFYQREEA
jgi:hypothetical protein